MASRYLIVWIERFNYNCNGKLKIQLNNNNRKVIKDCLVHELLTSLKSINISYRGLGWWHGFWTPF